MVFFESTVNDPYYNLALEEYFFEKMDRSESYFLLWQNDNTIVVGKYQNTAEEVNQQYVEEHGVKVARRLSGGGAVYHDMGNLNFTFITDKEEIDNFNFKKFVIPVINVLNSLGVKAEFTGRNDITIDGAKFSGNSQYMKKGRVMHHGCIMLSTDLSVVSKALQVREAKLESKAMKSVRSRVTTIDRHLKRDVSMDEFKELLKKEIFTDDDIRTAVLSDDDLREIEKLRDSKYATWDWNYGESPEYDMRKEKKYPGGLITVFMKAESSRIKEVKFYGDFFGNGEICELEESLRGAKLDESLLGVLEEIDISRYMNNISANELYDLLMH